MLDICLDELCFTLVIFIILYISPLFLGARETAAAVVADCEIHGSAAEGILCLDEAECSLGARIPCFPPAFPPFPCFAHRGEKWAIESI